MMEFWNSVEGKFTIDLALATLFGILIGAERELRGKDAGISTHSMVIIGAMMYTFLSTVAGDGDEARIAAQVVTGIGFLGAGIILKSEAGNIRNLTTAASIWYSGAIGMALGFNQHGIASVAALACIFIPRIPSLSRLGKNKEAKNEPFLSQ